MTKQLKVLIIEDSEDDAFLLLRELRKSGYELEFKRVETSGAMKEALEKDRWDIIISDYVLPDFSGLEALDILKESGRDIPFIIVSGNIGEDVAVGAMKAGAHDYIIKGNLKRLPPAIERELREAEVRRERARTKNELKFSHEKLRRLYVHLNSVREEERANLAREVHDELGQILSALKMDILYLNKKYDDHKALIEKTKTMSELVDAMIKTTKRIVTDLRPSILDHFGISAAVDWHVKEFQKRTGIHCELVANPEDIVTDRDISTTIFRICQEALTNVLRHAEATKVKISLEQKEGGIFLSIEDNGKGIAKENIVKPQSFGLVGIKERIAFIGGEVAINGIKDAGTIISVRIPVTPGTENQG
jgi:signal transduction histidine kinase